MILRRPGSILPSILRPQSQKCARCGAADKMNFQVSDDLWDQIAGVWHVKEFYDSVLCLACFDDLATEKNIEYKDHISNILFVGNKLCCRLIIDES